MKPIVAVRSLLVEDSVADATLIRETARTSGLDNPIDWVETGEDALARLRADDEELPDLILLDLHLPGMLGLELLVELKADVHLRRIPVVVLTSSDLDRDIDRAYDLGAAAYVNKPVGLEGFAKVVRGLDGFWLSIVRYTS